MTSRDRAGIYGGSNVEPVAGLDRMTAALNSRGWGDAAYHRRAWGVSDFVVAR